MSARPENVIGYLFDDDGREVCAVTFVDHGVPAAGELSLTLTLRGKVALTAALAATHHRTTPAELVDRLIAAEGERIGIAALADANETPAPRAAGRRGLPRKGKGGSAR